MYNLRDCYNLRCPCCKQADALHIYVSITARLSVGSTEPDHNADYEWDANSLTACPVCEFSAANRYFKSDGTTAEVKKEIRYLVKEYKHAVKAKDKSEIKHQQRVIERIASDFTPDQI